MRVRLYGKLIRQWKVLCEDGYERVSQSEYEYKEYDVKSGQLVGVGSEDFSPQRKAKQMLFYDIRTWDGVKRRADGSKWFNSVGVYRTRKGDRKALGLWASATFKAEEIRLVLL